MLAKLIFLLVNFKINIIILIVFFYKLIFMWLSLVIDRVLGCIQYLSDKWATVKAGCS